MILLRVVAMLGGTGLLLGGVTPITTAQAQDRCDWHQVARDRAFEDTPLTPPPPGAYSFSRTLTTTIQACGDRTRLRVSGTRWQKVGGPIDGRTQPARRGDNCPVIATRHRAEWSPVFNGDDDGVRQVFHRPMRITVTHCPRGRYRFTFSDASWSTWQRR